MIVPFIDTKRKILNLPSDYPAVVLFDHFSGQITQDIFDLLENHHIFYVLIPRTCTDRLQPMDLSVNKPVKDHLKRLFQMWYALQVEKQIRQNPGKSISPIDLRLSVIKPIHAQWLYDYIKSRPDIVINGFKAAGILNKIIFHLI